MPRRLPNRSRFPALSLAGALLLALAAAACGGSEKTKPTPAATDAAPAGTPTAEVASITLTSIFEAGAAIPGDYTCESRDVSPPLRWSGAPAGTAAFVLLMDAPDAPGGTFDHWVVYDLPSSVDQLDPAVPPGPALTDGGRQGKNSFNNVGYNGPCPPEGSEHHYRFRIFALDAALGLGPEKGKGEVEQAMRGHVIASGELIGTFKR